MLYETADDRFLILFKAELYCQMCTYYSKYIHPYVAVTLLCGDSDIMNFTLNLGR